MTTHEDKRCIAAIPMSEVTMFSLIALYLDYRKQQVVAPVLTTAPVATPANDREPMRARARAA